MEAKPHHHHHFAEKHAVETVALNGIAEKVPRRPPVPAVAKALADMKSNDWVLYGGAFDVPHEALKAQMADPTLFQAFAYSVLFRAGGGDTLSWGGSGAPGPDIKVEPSSRDALYDLLYGVLKGQFDAPQFKPGAPRPDPKAEAAEEAKREASRQALAKDLKVALGAEFDEKGFDGYHVHWDNSDDTTIEGAFAINPKTGEVRAVVAWQPA